MFGLVQGCVFSSEEEANSVAQRYEGMAINIANRFESNIPLNDRVQEAIFSLYKSIRCIKDKSKITCFLQRCVYNHLIDYMKKEQRYQPVEYKPDDEKPYDDFELEQRGLLDDDWVIRNGKMNEFFNMIPSDIRQLVYSVYGDDKFSIKNYAEQVGVTPECIYIRLKNIITMCKNYMDGEMTPQDKKVLYKRMNKYSKLTKKYGSTKQVSTNIRSKRIRL